VTSRLVLTHEREIACAPSIRSCEATRVRFEKNPDFKVTAGQCGIYRTKKRDRE